MKLNCGRFTSLCAPPRGILNSQYGIEVKTSTLIQRVQQNYWINCLGLTAIRFRQFPIFRGCLSGYKVTDKQRNGQVSYLVSFHQNFQYEVQTEVNASEGDHNQAKKTNEKKKPIRNMAKSLVCEEKLCTDQLSNSKNPERPQMDDDRIISMIKIKKPQNI